MLGKSNFSEKLKTVEMQSKRDRFSIRKLAVGTASILIGFNFMAANGQMVKADTVGSGSQETDIENSRQTENTETGLTIHDNAEATTDSKTASSASKTDVTTYSGLKSFLHDSSDQTASTKEIESPAAESHAETESADSAADLATAATDLQTEIKKGNDFVATEPFKQIEEDRQKAVTDAITQGQDVLDKYNKFVDTNDAAFKVSLFDLTDAKTTISAMITAATNNVDAQITPRMTLPNFGGWALDYNNGTLKINAVSSTNKVNGSSLLTTYLSTNGVNPTDITTITIESPINLNQTGLVLGNVGMFGNLPNLTAINNLNKITVVGSSLQGLFNGDRSLVTLDLAGFGSSSVIDMSYMFNGDTHLNNLSLQGFEMGGLGTNGATNMFAGVGTELPEDEAITLKLDGTVIPADALLGDGMNQMYAVDSTGARIGNIYVSGECNFDSFGNPTTGSNDAFKVGQIGITNLRNYWADGGISATYEMKRQKIDSLRYNVSDASDIWTVYLHPDQSHTNIDEKDSQNNEDLAFDDGTKVSDLLRNKTITSIAWNDATVNNPSSPINGETYFNIAGSHNEGYKVDDLEPITYYFVGSDAIANYDSYVLPGGQLDMSIPGPGSSDPKLKENFVKIQFADESSKYIRVKLEMKNVSLQASTKALKSRLPLVLVDDKFDPNSDEGKIIGSYINFDGFPTNKVDYYTLENNLFDGPLNMNYAVSSHSPGVMIGTTSAKIHIHYKDDNEKDPTSLDGSVWNPDGQIISVNNFGVDSMADYSAFTFNQLSTYPTKDSSRLLAQVVSQAKSEAPDTFVSAEWVGSPTFTTVGNTSATVKLHFKDTSSKEISVPINVKNNPTDSSADALAKEIVQGRQVEIEIPQYSDLVNDQTLASNVASSINLPKGTTFAWDQTKLPDTYTKGIKAKTFVIVTSSDGSISSIPVSVTIGDPVTQDIKLKHNAYLYNEYGERANGISLRSGSTVTVYGTRIIDGRKFYLTKDAAYYIAAGNNKPVTRKLDKDAYTYNFKGKKVVSAKRFKGEQIQTYGIPVVIKGKEYYAIGHRRYMRKVNFPPTRKWIVPRLTKQDLADGVVEKQLKHNAFVYTDKLDRANEVILSAGSIIQTRGTKTIGDTQYYSLGNNMYVNVQNVK